MYIHMYITVLDLYPNYPIVSDNLAYFLWIILSVFIVPSPSYLLFSMCCLDWFPSWSTTQARREYKSFCLISQPLGCTFLSSRTKAEITEKY